MFNDTEGGVFCSPSVEGSWRSKDISDVGGTVGLGTTSSSPWPELIVRSDADSSIDSGCLDSGATGMGGSCMTDSSLELLEDDWRFPLLVLVLFLANTVPFTRHA